MSSELLQTLRNKYPNWKIYNEPVKNCKCSGAGELELRSGREYPCLCVCLNGGSEERSGICKAVFRDFAIETGMGT